MMLDAVPLEPHVAAPSALADAQTQQLLESAASSLVKVSNTDVYRRRCQQCETHYCDLVAGSLRG